MDKYFRFFHRCFCISSFMTLLAFCADGLWRNCGCNYTCLFLGFVACSLLLFSWSKPPEMPTLAENTLWKDLCIEVPILRLISAARLPLLVFALLSACLYTTCLTWKHCGIACSYGLAALNQTEAAEQVFAWTNADSDQSFIAMSDVGDKVKPSRGLRSCELQNCELDKVLSRVYGPTSLQLAWRLEEHAYQVERDFADYRLAASYFKKSHRLYLQNNDPVKSLNALESLAYCQYSLHDLNGLQNSLDTGRQLLSPAGFDVSALKSFALIIQYAEDRELPVAKERVLLGLIKKPCLDFSRPEADRASEVLISILLILGFADVMRAYLLHRAKDKWERAFIDSKSIAFSLEQLDRLVVFELAEGNLTKADEYSRKSLELATAWKA